MTTRDRQLNHVLADLYYALDNDFKGKTYAEVIETDISDETRERIDKLVAHIKENY